MYKILVVDDEALARQNIIFKIKKSGFNFDWIKEAADATQALEIIHDTRPDILITDIKMKEVNGIELLEKVLIKGNNKNHEMVFIIISGYSEFTYAQNAIRLKVADYLLKPINQTDLTTSLDKAITSLQSRKQEQSVIVKQELLEQQKAQDILTKNMNLMLNCNIKPEKFKVRDFFNIIPQFFCVVVCRISDSNKKFFNSYNNGNTYMDYSLAKYAVSNIALELANQRIFCFENQNEYRQLVMVIATDSKDSRLGYINIKEDITKIYENIRQVTALEIDIGISSIESELSSELMQQAKSLMDLRLSKEEHIFYYDELSESRAAQFPDGEIKMFEQVAAAGDLYTMNKLVEKIIYSQQIDFTIRMIYTEIVCIMARVCYKKKIDSSLLLGTEVINGSIIDTFAVKQDLVDDIKKRIEQLFSKTSIGYENVNELMYSIHQYIDENFADKSLSTNIIARKFCISLGYLSSSFTKVFGVTITGYIVSKKLKYSCQLLTQTNISITNIAQMIGFNNLSYYMRAFKKQMNVTPTEYRENTKDKIETDIT